LLDRHTGQDLCSFEQAPVTSPSIAQHLLRPHWPGDPPSAGLRTRL